MNLRLDQKLRALVKSRLPEFVKYEYPMFVAFMEAYYEWMDTPGNPRNSLVNIPVYNDVDKTPDEFVKYFKEQFLEGIPDDILADKRLLVKHIKEFYRAKGSEKSYRLLFRILYNEDIDFYYPKTDILRVSDGKWLKEYETVFVGTDDKLLDIENAILLGLQDQFAVITNTFRNANNNKIYATLRDIQGEFTPGMLVKIVKTDGTVIQENLESSIISYEINDPEYGFNLGDNIQVVGVDNLDITVSDLIRAPIEKITIVNGGTNYEVGDKITFTGAHPARAIVRSVDGYGAITIVDIVYGGSYTSPPNYTIDSENGTGAELLLDDTKIGGIRQLRINNMGYNADNPISVNADITFSVGAVRLKEPKYINNDGHISTWNFIHDGHYYQEYSYDIKSYKTLDMYADIVKNLIHPAGLKCFGTYMFTRIVTDSLPEETLAYMTLEIPQYMVLSLSQYINLEII